jgi:hypothetical protein
MGYRQDILTPFPFPIISVHFIITPPLTYLSLSLSSNYPLFPIFSSKHNPARVQIFGTMVHRVVGLMQGVLNSGGLQRDIVYLG